MKDMIPKQQDPTFIIAEIGVNHNGNMDIARKLIDEAKLAGADAVKFQTFSAANLAGRNTPKVNYQKETVSADESHYEMLERLELSYDNHRLLLQYCNEVNIKFMSTPYDIDSAKFLQSLGVSYFKTASADIVDLPLHHFLASTGKLTFIAVGMATLGEVEEVVKIYHNLGNFNFVLLHAVSNYPASDESLNMRVMNTLERSFGVNVGYSDHSIGHLAAVIAISRGARVVEKHFTLDKTLPGPDHKASSTPKEFKDYVKNIRKTELMLGSSLKICQPEERQMASVSRKSIILSRNVDAGSVLEIDDFQLQRPGNGISPCHLNSLIGLRARQNLERGQQLRWIDLDDDQL